MASSSYIDSHSSEIDSLIDQIETLTGQSKLNIQDNTTNQSEVDNQLKSNYFDQEEITIVTALFDLSHREPSLDRSIDEYLIRGEYLLNLPYNIYIVTESHLAPRIWNYRKMLGLLDRTYIHILELNHSPYYQFHSTIERQFATGNKPSPNSPIIDRRMKPLYLIVGWTRFYCINLALKHNPFNSNGFIWLDYGIFYLYENKSFAYDGLIKALKYYPRDKLKVLSFEHTRPNEIKDLKEYYKIVRNKTATGMFGGSNKLMTFLVNEFDKNLRECLNIGYPALDEMIMNLTVVHNRKLFDFHYGKYNEI